MNLRISENGASWTTLMKVVPVIGIGLL